MNWANVFLKITLFVIAIPEEGGDKPLPEIEFKVKVQTEYGAGNV